MQLHKGGLYWDKSRKDTEYKELDSDLTTDILVIGGGMSGALISHTLGEEGFNVTVIDKITPGYGSSDGNTGIIQYNSDKSLPEMIEAFGEKLAVDFYSLSIEAMDKLDEIAKSLPDKVGYKRGSSLFLASKPEDLPDIIRNYETLKEHDFPAEFIDEETLLRDYDLVASGALKTSNDANLNPFKMVQALHKDNALQGVDVYKNTEALIIKEEEDGFLIKTRSGHNINCKTLIIAKGYAKGAYPPAEGKLQRNTTYSFVTDVIEIPLWGNEEMIWDSQEPYAYFRVTEDHRVIAGGRDEDGNLLSSDKEIEENCQKILDQIRDYYPQFKCEIAHMWQSVFGESHDGLPYIGRDPKNSNLFYALGYGGNGTCYSAMAAILISRYLKGDVHPLAYTTEYPRNY